MSFLPREVDKGRKLTAAFDVTEEGGLGIVRWCSFGGEGGVGRKR